MNLKTSSQRYVCRCNLFTWPVNPEFEKAFSHRTQIFKVLNNISASIMLTILEPHKHHLAGWGLSWQLAASYGTRICTVSTRMCVEVTPRWTLSRRMVGNHWYSDSEAANGSVADGAFVREEKWQLESIGAVFLISLDGRRMTFRAAQGSLLTLINYLNAIVY